MLQQEEKSGLKTGYLIFALIFFAYIMIYMTRNCFSAAMAQLVKEGVMKKSQTGLIVTLFYLVYAVLQVPGGMLADRTKPVWLILLGIIGAFVANAVIYFNHNYIVMLTFWVINGICQMGFWPAVFKVLASEVIEKNVKNSRFIYSTASAVGGSFSYLVAACVKKWNDNFLFSAVVMAITFILIVVFSKPINGVVSNKVTDKKEIKKTSEDKTNMLKIFVKSGFLLTAPAIFIWSFVKKGTSSLMSTMLMESYENVSTSPTTTERRPCWTLP